MMITCPLKWIMGMMISVMSLSMFVTEVVILLVVLVMVIVIT